MQLPMRSFNLIGIDIKCTSDQKRHSKSKTWVIIRSEKKKSKWNDYGDDQDDNDDGDCSVEWSKY